MRLFLLGWNALGAHAKALNSHVRRIYLHLKCTQTGPTWKDIKMHARKDRNVQKTKKKKKNSKWENKLIAELFKHELFGVLSCGVFPAFRFVALFSSIAAAGSKKEENECETGRNQEKERKKNTKIKQQQQFLSHCVPECCVRLIAHLKMCGLLLSTFNSILVFTERSKKNERRCKYFGIHLPKKKNWIKKWLTKPKIIRNVMDEKCTNNSHIFILFSSCGSTDFNENSKKKKTRIPKKKYWRITQLKNMNIQSSEQPTSQLYIANNEYQLWPWPWIFALFN